MRLGTGEQVTVHERKKLGINDDKNHEKPTHLNCVFFLNIIKLYCFSRKHLNETVSSRRIYCTYKSENVLCVENLVAAQNTLLPQSVK